MEKPKIPIQPDPSDMVKYPDPPTKEGRNYLGDAIYLPNENFIRDYKKYQKDKDNYAKDLELWEQLKFIKLIKVAKEKLILKKFKIIKR